MMPRTMGLAVPSHPVIKLAMIFLGSGVGGVLRYGVSLGVHGLVKTTFPLGTLVVNISGCLAMGFLAVALSGPLVREEHRALLLIGLLGGYTTFSAFGRETISLLHNGQIMAAMLNIALSNVLGLLGVWVGWSIGMRMYAGQVM